MAAKFRASDFKEKMLVCQGLALIDFGPIKNALCQGQPLLILEQKKNICK